MTYFELFELPVCLKVDKSSLTGKYFELQRKYHPDRFAQEGEAEQAVALELSSEVNKAYKTLQNPDETIKYVLVQKGLLQEEEKYQLSPDFLMEVMELNEALEVSGVAVDAAKNKIEQLQKEIYGPVAKIVEDYTEGIATEKELLQVKEYYYRKKYLDRILAGLK